MIRTTYRPLLVTITCDKCKRWSKITRSNHWNIDFDIHGMGWGRIYPKKDFCDQCCKKYTLAELMK